MNRSAEVGRESRVEKVLSIGSLSDHVIEVLLSRSGLSLSR